MVAGFVENFAAWVAGQRGASSSGSAPATGRAASPSGGRAVGVRVDQEGATSDALFAYMDQMRLALRAVGEELTAVSDRQVDLDRRVTEMSGIVQEVKEGQGTGSAELEQLREQTTNLERIYRTLAKSTRRALQEAVSAQQQLVEVQVEEEFSQNLLGSGFNAFTFGAPTKQTGASASPSQQAPSVYSVAASKDLGSNAEAVSRLLASFDVRLDAALRDVTHRLDSMHFERERYVAEFRGLGMQFRELSSHVEHLSVQCEHYFQKVQEYNVHFGFFRTSFEALREQVLEAVQDYVKRHHSSSGPTAERALMDEDAMSKALSPEWLHTAPPPLPQPGPKQQQPQTRTSRHAYNAREAQRTSPDALSFSSSAGGGGGGQLPQHLGSLRTGQDEGVPSRQQPRIYRETFSTSPDEDGSPHW